MCWTCAASISAVTRLLRVRLSQRRRGRRLLRRHIATVVIVAGILRNGLALCGIDGEFGVQSVGLLAVPCELSEIAAAQRRQRLAYEESLGLGLRRAGRNEDGRRECHWRGTLSAARRTRAGSPGRSMMVESRTAGVSCGAGETAIGGIAVPNCGVV